MQGWHVGRVHDRYADRAEAILITTKIGARTTPSSVYDAITVG
jgi:hypothetical protein